MNVWCGTVGAYSGCGAPDSVEHEILHRIAKEGVAIAECHAVAVDHPEHRHHRHKNEALHMVARTLWLRTSPPVKEHQPGRRHHQNKRRADEHPGVVTHVDRDYRRGRSRVDLEFRDHCGRRVVQGNAACEPKKQKREAKRED